MERRLGTYLIRREIGRGGMGTVFEALDEPTGRTVALKILPPELAREEAFVRRFRRETETLSTLDHLGIVRILDVGQEEGFYYYTMEYVGGPSLRSVLAEEGRLDPMRACEIGMQLCAALGHAHQHGIIHRDLKPANVLIDADGRARLTDFGIAKVVEATRMTATGGIVGTAEYMSPEQVEARPIDRRADLYSLGVLLYRMVTGRLPFDASSAVELMQAHRFSMFDAPRELNPDVPAALSALIEQLLEKDPSRRPPSAGVVQRELEGIHRMMEGGGGDLADVLFEKSEGRREEAAKPTRDRGVFIRGAWYAGVAAVIVVGALWATRPSSAGRLLRQGKQSLEDGYYKDAMATLHELIERYPEAPEATEAAALHEKAERLNYEHGKDLAALMETLASGLARGVIGRRGPDVPDPDVTAGEIAYARGMRDLMRRRPDEARRTFEAVAVLFADHEPEIALSARRMADDIAAGRVGGATSRPASRPTSKPEAAHGH